MVLEKVNRLANEQERGDKWGFERLWLEYVKRYNRWVNAGRPLDANGRWFDLDGQPLEPEDVLALYCGPQREKLELALSKLLASKITEMPLDANWPQELLVPLSAFKIELDSNGSEKILGKGGMGIVFAARDRVLNRLVAIKFIKPSHCKDAASVQLFREEARLHSNLRHHAIVQVYHYGEDDERGPFIVMSLLEGVTMDKILGKTHEYKSELLISIFIHICDAMTYAHKRGIVHYDLKPENIIVGSEGQVWVMDWGLGKRQTTSDESANVAQGTPWYLAPERANPIPGVKVDGKRTDVFGLGGLLCTLLTGEPPYCGQTKAEALQEAKKENLEPAYKRLKAVTSGYRELAVLARECLERSPADRPESAVEVSKKVMAYQAKLAQEREARIRFNGRVRIAILVFLFIISISALIYQQMIQKRNMMASPLSSVAINLDGRFSIPHSAQGDVLWAIVDQNNAILAYQRVAQLKDPSEKTYINLALLLSKRGETCAALQVLRDGLVMNRWFMSVFRFDMACYAVLVASGQAKDAPEKVDRSGLRREALAWLTAELAFQKLRSGNVTIKPIVHKAIVDWLANPDLASVRDVEKLPSNEREPWEHLWADIRQFRDDTAPGKIPPSR